MLVEDNFKEDKLIWKKRGMPDQIDPEENILLVIREDLIIIGFKVATYLIIFLLLLLGRIFLSSFSTTIGGTTIVLFYDVFLYTALSVLIVLFSYVFHNYYLSLQIVTTKRMIDIDQTGLFKREVNELAVEQIEDVTYKQNSFFATLFGFGTVSVQTSANVSTEKDGNKGLTGGFVFENIPQPEKVHAIVSNLFHQQGELSAINNAKLNAQYLHEKFAGQNPIPSSKIPYSNHFNNQTQQQTQQSNLSFKERMEKLREDSVDLD